jgi:hypothetical protein
LTTLLGQKYGENIIYFYYLRLTDIEGIEPSEMELHFQMSNEYEKVINFPLKSKPNNDYTVGVHIEGHESIQNFRPQRFHSESNQVLAGCKISPDGDVKIQSEQSVSVASAPEPLQDSDSTVLKIDYHFYGGGWKFLNVYPDQNNLKIAGEPKAFGIWIYGDGNGICPKMRILDSSRQVFQLNPESLLDIEWKGWRYVMFNLNNAGGHWGGSNDGIVHYPLQWLDLLLLDNEHSLNAKSTIYITAPIIIY